MARLTTKKIGAEPGLVPMLTGKVTHPKNAPSKARLTVEFLWKELPQVWLSLKSFVQLAPVVKQSFTKPSCLTPAWTFFNFLCVFEPAYAGRTKKNSLPPWY
ncbi:hypothetical protein MTR_4g036230 [Medicago truncatula]|uniref:Uncharacterized protein n=1 Tax=Medicago truncatula TaxID=3880 RepID=G7JRF1_MEDTR|nr:hypothetical protein MTR_4g036230 [Medicago truncatula]